jgi:hypothetical protein
MPPEVRTLLIRFREALERAALPADELTLAADLVDHLLRLCDDGKLTAPFLKLALEPFQDTPQIEQIAGPLVRFAAHQSAAMGHRDFERSDALPWIVSSYSDLEPKATLGALEGLDAPRVSPRSLKRL